MHHVPNIINPAAGKKNAGGVFSAPGAGRKGMTNATINTAAHEPQAPDRL